MLTPVAPPARRGELTSHSPDVDDLEGGDDDLHGGRVDARLHLDRDGVHVHRQVVVGPQVHKLGRAVGDTLIKREGEKVMAMVCWVPDVSCLLKKEKNEDLVRGRSSSNFAACLRIWTCFCLQLQFCCGRSHFHALTQKCQCIDIAA